MARTVDEFLAAARARLDRVPLERLDAEVASGALVVDIRPSEDRAREGEMPGALIIESNVILWRLSPTSDARVVDVAPDQKVIVFCNDGYAASLVAVALQEVGVAGATDLIGGYRVWRAAQS